MVDREIISRFINLGYQEVLDFKLPTSLEWRPDFILSKDGYTFLVLTKSNNSIPPGYLNRIVNIPQAKFVPLIVFGQKMVSKQEKNIQLLGISFAYFIDGDLQNITLQKKLPTRTIKREIENKLTSIHIFISSKQDIDERLFVDHRLLKLRDIHHYPFFTHLIEYDDYDNNELFEHIDEELDYCDWIVIVLEDEYSETVSYEIENSLKFISHKNILMFVKSTQVCKNIWKNELDMIKNLPNKSVHYLQFYDLNNLEVTLTRAVNSKMTKIMDRESVNRYRH